MPSSDNSHIFLMEHYLSLSFGLPFTLITDLQYVISPKFIISTLLEGIPPSLLGDTLENEIQDSDFFFPRTRELQDFL